MTPENRMKIGAGRLGIPFEEYRANVEAGLKFCAGHRAWEAVSRFGVRSSKPDGLENHCRELVNERSREYQRWLRNRHRAKYNAEQARQKREQRAQRARLRRSA